MDINNLEGRITEKEYGVITIRVITYPQDPKKKNKTDVDCSNLSEIETIATLQMVLHAILQRTVEGTS